MSREEEFKADKEAYDRFRGHLDNRNYEAAIQEINKRSSLVRYMGEEAYSLVVKAENPELRRRVGEILDCVVRVIQEYIF